MALHANRREGSRRDSGFDPTRDDFYGTAVPTACRTTCDPSWINADIVGWPAVVDGNTLYQASRYGLYPLDARTGDVIWRTERPAKGLLSEPTIARGIVFVTFRGNRGGVHSQALRPRHLPRKGGGAARRPSRVEG